MDAITAARELGKAIQADPRYKDYVAAKAANDADEGLQKLISDFSAKRSLLQAEMAKEADEQDGEKIPYEQGDAGRIRRRDEERQYGELRRSQECARYAAQRGQYDNLDELRGRRPGYLRSARRSWLRRKLRHLRRLRLMWLCHIPRLGSVPHPASFRTRKEAKAK